MDTISTVVAAVIFVPTVVVIAYPVLAGRMFRRRTPARASDAAPVAVIVPCKGATNETSAALRSLLAQQAPFPLEIVFCVESGADSVVPIIENLLRDGVHRARVVLTGDAGRDLGKLHNLIAGIDATTSECVLLIDSDVVFDDAGAVAAFVADLERPGVRLVSSFPAYRGARNVPAAVLGMSINNDLLGCFAVVACARSLPVANGCCLAIRRSVLEAIGGLESLRTQALMDTTLARRVAACGYRVHLHNRAVPIVRCDISWRECWLQSLRWQVSMRRVLSLQHYLAFSWLRSAGVVCAVGLFVSSFSPAMWSVTAIFLAARMGSAWWMDARYLRGGFFARFAWAFPLVEVFNGVTVTIAWFARRIEWGGRRYRVERGGRVIPVDAVPAKRRGPQPAL